jgi:hypothetical protein
VQEWDEEVVVFEKEKRAVEMSGLRAIGRRGKRVRTRGTMRRSPCYY